MRTTLTQTELDEWLKTRLDKKKLIMDEVLYIHEKLEKELCKLDLRFNKEYPVILIKLASFLYYHSV